MAQFIKYRFRGQVRSGVIVGWNEYPGKPFYYSVENDAGRVVNVRPEWIIDQ